MAYCGGSVTNLGAMGTKSKKDCVLASPSSSNVMCSMVGAVLNRRTLPRTLLRLEESTMVRLYTPSAILRSVSPLHT